MSANVYVLSPDDPYQMEAFKRFAPEDAEIIWVDNKLSVEEQAAQLRDARAIVIVPSAFSVELALKCPNLQLLQSVSAGTNRVDI
jgi:phosphoglycerate dehydrogenase-like enzyme